MGRFRSKRIEGREYDLSHLDDFRFDFRYDELTYSVGVIFGCHCFTEKLGAHSPDLHYEFENEIRAFCFKRYEASHLLPDLIRGLPGRTVYHGKDRNFFHLRQDVAPGLPGTFMIFFDVIQARKAGLSALLNVQSAYVKPNMADRASPIKFTTLIDFTAKGRRPTYGPVQSIKRK